MSLWQLLNKNIVLSLIATAFMLTGCEEKFPEYVIDNPPVEFMRIDIGTEGIVQDTTIEVKSKLGESDYLFVGEDENVSSYILMRFSNLLDEVNADSILDLKLVLYTSLLCADTSISPFPAVLSLLKGEANWKEDTTSYSNFSIDEVNRENIDTLLMRRPDTVYVELEDSLYSYWRDTSNNGLVILPLDTINGMLLTIYSSESGSTKPKLFVEYIHEGDTLTHVHYCSEDVSVLRFKKEFRQDENLSLSKGFAYRSYMLANFPDSVGDNYVVAKCELRLRIDHSSTEHYDERFSFYTAYVDTGMWLDPENLPGIRKAVLTSVAVEDSVAVIDLKEIAQEAIELQRELRLAMWPSPHVPDISVLSVFGTRVKDMGLKPSIELILMREK